MASATSDFQTPCDSTSQQPTFLCSNSSGSLEPDLLLQWEGLFFPPVPALSSISLISVGRALISDDWGKIWLSTSAFSWSVFISLSVVLIRKHTGFFNLLLQSDLPVEALLAVLRIHCRVQFQRCLSQLDPISTQPANIPILFPGRLSPIPLCYTFISCPLVWPESFPSALFPSFPDFLHMGSRSHAL